MTAFNSDYWELMNRKRANNLLGRQSAYPGMSIGDDVVVIEPDPIPEPDPCSTNMKTQSRKRARSMQS